MIAKVDYRKTLVDTVCKECAYQGICGLSEEYDCKAFKVLVKIYEDLDSYNPDN